MLGPGGCCGEDRPLGTEEGLRRTQRTSQASSCSHPGSFPRGEAEAAGATFILESRRSRGCAVELGWLGVAVTRSSGGPWRASGRRADLRGAWKVERCVEARRVGPAPDSLRPASPPGLAGWGAPPHVPVCPLSLRRAPFPLCFCSFPSSQHPASYWPLLLPVALSCLLSLSLLSVMMAAPSPPCPCDPISSPGTPEKCIWAGPLPPSFYPLPAPAGC